MKTAVLAALMLLSTTLCNSQWLPTNGPYGGSVQAFCANGSCMFAGAGGSVYRSTNYGASWTETSYGGVQGTIQALFAHGGKVYAGTAYVSTDDGSSWMPLAGGLSETSITAFAAIDSTIFIGTSHGVFVSTDNGLNWKVSDSGSVHPGGQVAALAVVGSTLFATDGGNGVFRSTDNGTSWIQTNSSPRTWTALIARGTDLYLAFFGTVLRSSNLGETWNEADSGLAHLDIRCMVAMGNTLVAGTAGNSVFPGATGGIFLSNDDGMSWSRVEAGATVIQSLFVQDSVIFAGTPTGVLRSTDGGKHWIPMNSGITNSGVGALADDGANLFAGTVGCGVFRTADNGANWQAVNSGLTDLNIYALLSTRGKLFAGTREGAIFRSTNAGDTWAEVASGLGSIQAFACSGTKLFAGVPGGLYTSTNDGQGWERFLTAGVRNIAVVGSTIYIDGLFYSTDEGTSWAANPYPSFGAYVLDLVANDEGVFVGTMGAGVFLSTDHGQVWTAVNNGLDNKTVLCMGVNGPNVFVGAYARPFSSMPSIYCSNDNGGHWKDVSANLVGQMAGCFLVKGELLFAGIGPRGVFVRPLIEVTGVEEPQAGTPATFTLSQNFPNPFNPSTVIKYSVGGTEEAGTRGSGLGTRKTSLIVYDLLGRQVATLVDEAKAPGSYQVTFDASGLASGVYLYRLQAGTYVETKKLVVLK